VSYQLLCQCGRAIAGARQRRHQVVPCPACGRAVFVLPRSAYAPAEGVPARPPRRWWRGPLLAGAGCVALLLLAFVLVLPRLMRPRQTQKSEEEFDLSGQVEKGRRQMGQGKFRLARRTLDDAVRRRDRDPAALSAAQHRELNQLHRQADLLGRLLNVTLAEVVRHAQLSRDAEEWALRFEDFRGRSVIFDDAVGRDDRDRPVLAHDVVEVKDERVRMALEDLAVMHDLPLEARPRLVFGARLAGCEREPGGGWVVRFERESGVLLTDHDAVAAALTQPPDEGLKLVLARQQRWLDERAAAAPARP
jgi:hypothetical protein